VTDSEPINPLSVKLKKVSFTYNLNESETIHGVDLDIPPGCQAAFIGVSGSGKSTLADLILGQLTPTSGEVLLSGKPPMLLAEAFPGLLGYVPQRPGMVSGTIAQNIALGAVDGEFDEQRLMEAVRDAHLDDVVKKLPEGIYTDIGKRKDELSGGQIQRIGLARALYSKPKLLILDEATSALDAESENEINIAINEMRGKVTVVLVAHRLNTIQRSDLVFLIADGKVSDSGKFEELLRRNKNLRKQAQLMDIRGESPKKIVI
jgi:ATP-binding cassette subfamily C protein